MKSGTVSILGCGWLGVALAGHLLRKGFSLKGSVTSAEKLGSLRNLGIQAYQIVLNETNFELSSEVFFDCDVLIISIPPRRIQAIEHIFPAQIGHLIPLIRKSGIQKVLFISSTSVYPDLGQIAIETDVSLPDKESGNALLTAENLLKSESDFKTTILRFGGLIGENRNPARFLQKTSKALANIPVNLIHQEDCIRIISEIIEQELWGETLNACCPEHPLKKDFYGKASQISGLPEPLMSDEKASFKLVDSNKLIRLLNYQFRYPNPMDFLDSIK